MSDDKIEKLTAHTVALEQNQEALRQQNEFLRVRIQNLQKALQDAAIREAELQTKINALEKELAEWPQRMDDAISCMNPFA